MNHNDLLHSHQFGFREGLSTEDAIFKLIHEILTALNNKVMVGGIFFDLAKAFDSANHVRLIHKLQYYEISGKAKSLIESYLANRCQKIQLDDNTSGLKSSSNWTRVKHGVL